jgi:YD repeat-containing protein
MGTATLIYFVLLVCPLYTSTATTAGKTDREKASLVGPVHVVREETASISQKDGKPVEGPRGLRSITVYDAAGHQTKVLPPDRWLTAKTYDTKGNLTEELVYRWDGAQCWKHVYTYDERGRKTTYTNYDLIDGREWPAERHVYKYDDKGDLIEDGSYYGDGSLKEKSSYTHVYGPDGKKTEESRHREDLLSGRTTYLYDKNGNLVEQTNFDAEGALSQREIWRYDDRGKLLVENATYGSDGSLESKFTYTYEFDSTGNSVKRNVSARIKEEENKYSEPSWVVYRTLACFGDPNENRAKELQADLLAMESRAQETMHPKEEPRLRVEVRLYGDGNHTKELCFFDRTGVTLPRAVHYAIRSTSGSAGAATTLSGGIYDPTGRLVQDLSGKSTDGDGSYKGSYDFQAGSEPGVWLLKVNCEKSGHSPTSTSVPLHLYSGRGVSAYKMDFDRTSFREESILENRHLIAVFGNATVSNQVLAYLYQKDTGTSYTFGTTNDGRFDYLHNRFAGHGEVSSDQSTERRSSCKFGQNSESVGLATLSVDVSHKAPQNELLTAELPSPWAKPGAELCMWTPTPNGFAETWKYTDDNLYMVWDKKIGDADNDGDNEIVVFTREYLMVFEKQATEYVNVWKGPALGRFSTGQIADVDNDGDNEIVAQGQKALYVCEFDGAGYRVASQQDIDSSIPGCGVGDFDQDGENEIAVTRGVGQILIYEFDGATYANTARIPLPPTSAIDDLATGDIDGDGFPEIAVCGNSKRFQVIDWAAGVYTTMYLSDTDIGYVQTCALGDTNNDGKVDLIAGGPRLVCFEYRDGTLVQTWKSESFARNWGLGMHITTIADADNDGLNEIVFVKPRRPLYELAVWKSEGGESRFRQTWAHALPEGRGLSYPAVGDANNDGRKTTLVAEISLPSEEADWLEYRVHDMKVDPNIHVVFPILSGSLGSGKDDRFHLEKGADDRIANLKPNTWHDFSDDASSYCMVYDSSSETDNVDGAVLAWVRLKESGNVKFRDVGLWNDSNGNAASRIRYDLKKATPEDSFTCLLVFTKGDKQTIDRWMPGIKSGKLPDKSFAVSPEG